MILRVVYGLQQDPANKARLVHPASVFVQRHGPMLLSEVTDPLRYRSLTSCKELLADEQLIGDLAFSCEKSTFGKGFHWKL
ncbi:hypothetical protein J6590_046063 [Homalodisca vitripennis]|nr:hypothetical protein J6590_046063 [Homalodisca vitripennis]